MAMLMPIAFTDATINHAECPELCQIVCVFSLSQVRDLAAKYGQLQQWDWHPNPADPSKVLNPAVCDDGPQ